MRRIMSAIILFCLLTTCAGAEEGIFVPNYNSFMSSFDSAICEQYPDVSQLLVNIFKDNGKWSEVKSSARQDRYLLVDEETWLEITTNEHHGQLEFFSMRMPCGSSEDAIQQFIDVARIAAHSIAPSIEWDNYPGRIFNSISERTFSKESNIERRAWNGMHRYSVINLNEYVYFVVEVITDEGEDKIQITPFGYEYQ